MRNTVRLALTVLAVAAASLCLVGAARPPPLPLPRRRRRRRRAEDEDRSAAARQHGLLPGHRPPWPTAGPVRQALHDAYGDVLDARDRARARHRFLHSKLGLLAKLVDRPRSRDGRLRGLLL